MNLHFLAFASRATRKMASFRLPSTLVTIWYYLMIYGHQETMCNVAQVAMDFFAHRKVMAVVVAIENTTGQAEGLKHTKLRGALFYFKNQFCVHA